VFRAGEDRAGQPIPAVGDRRGEERPAPCRDGDGKAERAGGEDHERMQLGMRLRHERRGHGVDVLQALVDDVPDRPDRMPRDRDGQGDERDDGNRGPKSQPRG
jgi:hypothetical protein